MTLWLLPVTVILKILLCKGFWLGILLLLFWGKGKLLRLRPEAWEDFFLSLPPAKALGYGAGIYLAAALGSTAVSYGILTLAGFQHSLAIAAVLFFGGAAVTAFRFSKKKDSLLDQYQKIPQKILAARGRTLSGHG